MSLVVSWLLFPLVLGLLTLGCGLLLGAAAGVHVQRVLLMPLGFAVIVVVSLIPLAVEVLRRPRRHSGDDHEDCATPEHEGSS